MGGHARGQAGWPEPWPQGGDQVLVKPPFSGERHPQRGDVGTLRSWEPGAPPRTPSTGLIGGWKHGGGPERRRICWAAQPVAMCLGPRQSQLGLILSCAHEGEGRSWGSLEGHHIKVTLKPCSSQLCGRQHGVEGSVAGPALRKRTPSWEQRGQLLLRARSQQHMQQALGRELCMPSNPSQARSLCQVQLEPGGWCPSGRG